MIVKLVAAILILGACYALPVEESKPLTIVPPSELVPIEPIPVQEGSPEPANPDKSDLKPDESSWWHSWYHYNYPNYHYNVHKVPYYKYRSQWHSHW